MKKLVILAASLVLLLGGYGASALVGPEPGAPPFDIVLQELEGGPRYDTLHFDTAPNGAGFRWDFGDREGYRCAFVEGFVGATQALRLEFEQAFDYDILNPPGFQINDRGGVEHGDGSNPPFPAGADPCGTDAGGGVARNRWVPSGGEDHFPHYLLGHTVTAPVRIYWDGLVVELMDFRRGECDDWYWVPGDEPGEVVGFQDEDGPTFDGHMDLPCGGGATEPFLAARAFFILTSPRAGVCVDDSMDGTRCMGMTSPPPSPPPPSPTCVKRCGYTPPPKD